jgi:hypothetical protein
MLEDKQLIQVDERVSLFDALPVSLERYGALPLHEKGSSSRSRAVRRRKNKFAAFKRKLAFAAVVFVFSVLALSVTIFMISQKHSRGSIHPNASVLPGRPRMRFLS